ncbi:hypothetical protein DPMN_003419 [Dreissena polymorpha]|uniref:Uncharacterized protein n=1 Tax=Dreissena polymorpha TaxID=45954 RepID=A0A9D4MND9_DREPO|nr:hypothetical protein DPMN_003419 [Dreissena polymorpha]
MYFRIACLEEPDLSFRAPVRRQSSRCTWMTCGLLGLGSLLHLGGCWGSDGSSDSGISHFDDVVFSDRMIENRLPKSLYVK